MFDWEAFEGTLGPALSPSEQDEQRQTATRLCLQQFGLQHTCSVRREALFLPLCPSIRLTPTLLLAATVARRSPPRPLRQRGPLERVVRGVSPKQQRGTRMQGPRRRHERRLPCTLHAVRQHQLAVDRILVAAPEEEAEPRARQVCPQRALCMGRRGGTQGHGGPGRLSGAFLSRRSGDINPPAMQRRCRCIGTRESGSSQRHRGPTRAAACPPCWTTGRAGASTHSSSWRSSWWTGSQVSSPGCWVEIPTSTNRKEVHEDAAADEGHGHLHHL